MISTKQNNKKFGTTLLVITTITIGVLLFLWRTLIMGSGNTTDYIFQGMGSLAATTLFAFIPYFILKRYFKKSKLVIFSISFLLINIIILMGILYRG